MGGTRKRECEWIQYNSDENHHRVLRRIAYFPSMVVFFGRVSGLPKVLSENRRVELFTPVLYCTTVELVCTNVYTVSIRSHTSTGNISTT